MFLHVGVAHILLDRHALDDPGAAKQFERLFGNALHRGAGKCDRHVLVGQGFDAAVFDRFGMILHPRRGPDQATRRLQIHRHFGNRQTHGLMLDDGFAAGDTLLHVFERFFIGGAAEAEGQRGDGRMGAHVGAALGRRRQDASGRNAYIVEHHLGGVVANPPPELRHRPARQPGRVALDEK